MYNLLIVEDESLIRRGIRAFIDFDGLGIGGFFEAENGEEALDTIRRHHIDLILADINMPKMNVLNLRSFCKISSPSIKIAILTGYDYLDYAIRAIKIGVDDYALKPLSRDDIQKLLFHLVEKKTIKSATSVNQRPCICFEAERFRANTRARKLAVTKSKRLMLLHILKREKYFPNPIQHRLGGTRGTIP